MQARVISNENGKIYATVRRGYRVEPVQGIHPDIRPGHRIVVRRVRNNPYLVLVLDASLQQSST